MIMKIRGLGARAAAMLLLACGTAGSAHAATVVFSDNFDSIPGNATNTAPSGWTAVSGSVDSVLEANGWGLTCNGTSGGCVDLDGSTGAAGTLVSSTTLNLLAGTTYLVEAYVSGNQLGDSYLGEVRGPDALDFGFWSGGSPVAGAWTSTSSIAASQDFTLVSRLFTPSSNTSASVFFRARDIAGPVFSGDNVGPILDDVKVSAVPLPAAGWLMLSGLAAFGAFGRRRRAFDAGHPVAAA